MEPTVCTFHGGCHYVWYLHCSLFFGNRTQTIKLLVLKHVLTWFWASSIWLPPLERLYFSTDITFASPVISCLKKLFSLNRFAHKVFLSKMALKILVDEFTLKTGGGTIYSNHSINCLQIDHLSLQIHISYWEL